MEKLKAETKHHHMVKSKTDWWKLRPPYPQPVAREDVLYTSIIKCHFQQVFEKSWKLVGRRKNVEIMLLFFKSNLYLFFGRAQFIQGK